ncbi:amino acid ABC transporter permease [Nordella sp. HKS 07]|uniref:amino acid ABC transporter permease n=1 Tax=Nordella sp. HKS 07 TaxID=2712222 RepID=UPI0013E10CF0|nr:amino acid ABC transporter permease [Nordella sp. HKS 07]QIG51131.1 amino acid ABC transporter permease [Nordella sp. HKS 07]
MRFLKRLRPSNLIILSALPFIIYIFAASPDYRRSLAAILGIEHGSSLLLPGFVLLLAAFASGLAALHWYRSRPQMSLILAGLNLALAAWLTVTTTALPFIASIVANSVDPFTSDLVIKGETPRRLTEATLAAVAQIARTSCLAYALLSFAGFAFFFSRAPERLRRIALWGLAAINGAGLLYLLLFAYLGFAAGLATSIRAAILAYILAILLGLCWVMLLQLQLVRRSFLVFPAIAALFAAGAAWQFLQPAIPYTLAGTLTGKVAVIQNTPRSLIDAVRFAQFPGAPEVDELPLKTFATAEAALKAVAQAQDVSAALVPSQALTSDSAAFWQTASLPDHNKSAGTAFAIAAIVTALLTFGGLLHQRHPLSIGAEFIIDILRGIPMLVVVLYVGLPLSGALKEGTGGFIDPPNLMRGIAAMALAYFAYLAEIFRAGLKAVPPGQIEAARSLGLSRWTTARLVIIPQAFRVIIPPLGNEFIAILKDTSLLSILSIRDITQRMREFQSASFLPFAPYNSAAIFYVLLTLAAASLITSIERKYDVKHR